MVFKIIWATWWTHALLEYRPAHRVNGFGDEFLHERFLRRICLAGLYIGATLGTINVGMSVFGCCMLYITRILVVHIYSLSQSE